MRRIAIIDLGSNALRFEIYQVRKTRHELIFRDRSVLRLGSGVYQTAKLDPHAKTSAIEAFQHIRQALDGYHVDEVFGVATSAFRSAADGEQFLHDLEESCGVRLRIISGEEEAELIAKGVLTFETNLPDPCILIDIGGGSTEITHSAGRNAVAHVSVPLGAIRCQQQFLHQAPPSPAGLNELRYHIRLQLEESGPHFKSLRAADIVGSSGTARTIAELLPELNPMPAEALDALFERLAPLTIDQLCAVPGMAPNRADVIVAGLVILQECTRHFGAEAIYISRFSLRHGLLAGALDSTLR